MWLIAWEQQGLSVLAALYKNAQIAIMLKCIRFFEGVKTANWESNPSPLKKIKSLHFVEGLMRLMGCLYKNKILSKQRKKGLGSDL